MHARNLFLSTLSLRRATWNALACNNTTCNFYPRSPCGERREKGEDCRPGQCHFYPRSPCGERRYLAEPKTLGRHFYPRSPCGERHGDWLDTWDSGEISIHALLAESDLASLRPRSTATRFLSTLSLRRATACMTLTLRCFAYFYPRSPCGERRSYNFRSRIRQGFLSTLSLRRATYPIISLLTIPLFLSTLSLRRATDG